ncbi:MAG: hypothetical protein K8R40_02415 [Anaerolineaceae bacterium]|nr:hypothetical protein [Anaerolineaceae bacterium]
MNKEEKLLKDRVTSCAERIEKGEDSDFVTAKLVYAMLMVIVVLVSRGGISMKALIKICDIALKSIRYEERLKEIQDAGQI